MSRLLVDTHVLLWWLTDDPALSPAARDAIADPVNEPFVSAASVWEIAIKRSLGKLTAPDDLPDRIADEGFAWLPISAEPRLAGPRAALAPPRSVRPHPRGPGADRAPSRHHY